MNRPRVIKNKKKSDAKQLECPWRMMLPPVERNCINVFCMSWEGEDIGYCVRIERG